MIVHKILLNKEELEVTNVDIVNHKKDYVAVLSESCTAHTHKVETLLIMGNEYKEMEVNEFPSSYLTNNLKTARLEFDLAPPSGVDTPLDKTLSLVVRISCGGKVYLSKPLTFDNPFIIDWAKDLEGSELQNRYGQVSFKLNFNTVFITFNLAKNLFVFKDNKITFGTAVLMLVKTTNGYSVEIDFTNPNTKINFAIADILLDSLQENSNVLDIEDARNMLLAFERGGAVESSKTDSLIILDIKQLKSYVEDYKKRSSGVGEAVK